MNKQSLFGAVCAMALMCGAVAIPTTAFAPSAAYAQVDVSFALFHGELSRYGDWVYSDRWGEVWIPDVGPDFRPYDTAGYWADTDDYGWTWVSDYPWGDITFHYGRWVNDPYDGWMWIPGYVWAPSWVVWRSNDRYAGWMPMPPDDRFLAGEFDAGGGRISFAINFDDDDDYYGYRRWYGPSYDFTNLWVFVGYDHLADRDFRRYRAPRNEYRTYINNTRNITNYTIVNNVIFNRSIDRSRVERARGRPVERMRGEQVFKRPQFVTRIDQGQRAQQQNRDVTRHGRGTEGSAPRPTQQVVDRLSDKIGERRGHPSRNLYTRETIQRAPEQIRPANVQQNAGPQNDDRRGLGRAFDRNAQPPQGDQRRDQQRDQQRVQQEQQDRQREQAQRDNQQRSDQDRQRADRQRQDQDRQREQAQREGQQRQEQDRQRADRQRQDQDRQREQTQREEQRRGQERADQQRQGQERERADRQRQDQDRQREQAQRQEQQRAQQMQQRQQEQQQRQAAERQQQDQQRAQQMQQRQQEQQQRQAAQRQQQDQQRAQQRQAAQEQQRQQQEQQRQAQQQQQQQQQQQDQQRQARGNRGGDDGSGDDQRRGGGRGRDRDN